MICTLCNTLCGTVNSPILPEGPKDATVLIILDELSSQQDFAGSYYSGKHGRLLTEIIESSGLSRENCVVISVAGCRGKGISPYLTRLLADRRFRTICTLGDESLRVVCKKTGVREKRGGTYPIHKTWGISGNVRVGATYGLGDILNNPNYKKVVIQDIRTYTETGSDEEVLEWRYWDETTEK